MLNKVMLIGNLGKDPELRYTSGGQAVCDFRIATSESYTDREGQKQDKTEWHSVVVWGKQAENCKRYLGKGRRVFVEGKLQTREWEDKSGNKRYTTEVVAMNVRFLDTKGSSGPGGMDDPPPPSDMDAPSYSAPESRSYPPSSKERSGSGSRSAPPPSHAMDEPAPLDDDLPF